MNRIRYLEIRMVPVGLGSEGQSLHELETEQMLGREENNGVYAGLKGGLPKHVEITTVTLFGKRSSQKQLS